MSYLSHKKTKKLCMNRLNKINLRLLRGTKRPFPFDTQCQPVHLHFDFDACPVHSPLVFVHLTHQNLSVCALFWLNSLAEVNMHF